MKTAYTYVTLRYTHDISTREFVNVGVLMRTTTERAFVHRLDGDLRRVTNFFQTTVEEMREKLNCVSHLLSQLDFDAMERHYFFNEDSGFSLSSKGFGICEVDKLDATADRLFERLVARYAIK